MTGSLTPKPAFVKVIGMIPARLGATRLPGKVLLDIAGKPMVQHVYERAQEARYLDEVRAIHDLHLSLRSELP